MQEKINKKKLKRLVIEISEEMHQEIKFQALKRNISMRTWVTRVLYDAIKREKQYE